MDRPRGGTGPSALGEAVGVPVGDVDFLRRAPTVQRRVQRPKGDGVAGTPPKHASERALYPPDGLVTIHARHTEEHVPGENIDPLHQNIVEHRRCKARRTAESPSSKPHVLRHCYASELIAEGCARVTVQRVLDHGSASVTRKIHTPVAIGPEDRTRAATREKPRRNPG